MSTRMRTILFAVALMQLKSLRCNAVEVSSYSKVATNGVKTATDVPRLHRAREGVMNADLIFPKVFNVSDAPTNTGRAVDSRPFSFPLNTFHSRIDSSPHIVYSRPINSKKYAQDRFVPHETYAYTQSKRNPDGKQRNRQKESDREDVSVVTGMAKQSPIGAYSPPQSSNGNIPPPSSNTYNPPQSSSAYIPPLSSNTYIPPKDLYAFPPNIDSIYPPPGYPDKSPIYMGPSSADPAPSGDVGNMDDMGDANNLDNTMMDARPSDGVGGADANSDGVGGADASSDGNAQNDNGPADDMAIGNGPGSQPPLQRQPFLPTPSPPSDGDYNAHHFSDDPPFHDIHHDNHFDHPPFSGFGPSRPSDLPFTFDPSVLKDDHDHDHFHDAIVFDHDHDFFDFHHPHHFRPPPRPLPPRPPPPPPPPPPTTPPPPPEPEEPQEQPRVKKYSYFYLSRTLWYIPLYFTVWFTFYVTWLILQSIGRHKVDLPNHITGRHIRDLTHKETVEKVDALTQFVMTQIEDFKLKYTYL